MNRKTNIAEIIRAYDEQGIHRTGTAVDNASGDWLCAEIRNLGVEPVRTVFKTARVDVGTALIKIDSTSIPGLPLFDCHYTDAVGITRIPGELGSESAIGVILAPPQENSEPQRSLQEARQRGTHEAILVVNTDAMPTSGIAPVNAESFLNPFGPPVLQLPYASWDLIQDSIVNQKPIRVIIEANRIPSSATNISTKISGRQPDLPPLVVMTPRSGWWECASERGGGIATLLEVMRHFIETTPERDVLFTLNTGHELGHTGLDHFLETNPDLIKDAHCWIHLGANFVARDNQLVFQYSDEDIQRQASALLRSFTLPTPLTVDPGVRPGGEARNIFDGEGRYFSLLATNPLFHHPADRYPDAVNLDQAVACTEFVIALADELARA